MVIPTQLSKLKFCRVRKKTKKPFEKDWTNKPYSYDEIKKYFPKENYGVLCGYENLAVIDSDNEAFQVAIDALLPDTFKVKTTKGFHNYYFIPELKQKIILDAGDIHLGEVQSYGTQVVGAGSIHPSGEKYEISNEVPIANLNGEILFDFLKPFIKKEVEETEEIANYEKKNYSEIDDLSVADIWGTPGLKKQGGEYYGSHPTHGSGGGMNFWINPLKNMWHCFRCQSGGGVLSAIAVKEGIIDCSEARRGFLRGSKARKAIGIAKDKYGLKDREYESKTEIEKQFPDSIKSDEKEEINIIWEKDLKNYQQEEKEWIIDRLIPTKSVCILTGKRGTLKTFVTLAMSYAISSGESFLNEFDTQKGSVIYLDKENGIGIMKKRTAMLKEGLDIKDGDFPIGFICFSQLKIDKLGDVMSIEKIIEEHKPTLLVIDTYRRSIGFDENDAQKVSMLFVDTLRPIVEKNDVSILLIHHNRKSSGHGEVPDEMDELRGSSDLANYADIILKLERKGDNLILKQLKNRNAEEEKPIKIRCEFSTNSPAKLKMIYEGEYLKQNKVISFPF